MPPVARRNVDAVDVLARQQFPHIDVDLAVLVTVMAVDHVLDAQTTLSAHIAVRDELDVLLRQRPTRQHPAAAAADANARHHQSIGRRDLAIKSQRGRGYERRQRSRAQPRQKRTT